MRDENITKRSAQNDVVCSLTRSPQFLQLSRRELMNCDCKTQQPWHLSLQVRREMYVNRAYTWAQNKETFIAHSL